MQRYSVKMKDTRPHAIIRQGTSVTRVRYIRLCISEAWWSMFWALGRAFDLAAQSTLITAGSICSVAWEILNIEMLCPVVCVGLTNCGKCRQNYSASCLAILLVILRDRDMVVYSRKYGVQTRGLCIIYEPSFAFESLNQQDCLAWMPRSRNEILRNLSFVR
jgi:hypothetical protein